MVQLDFQSEKPIYLQIAEGIEDAIFTGAFIEETQIPSTTEISTQYTINPATVLKGMGILVDEGILYKKRGVGMFVKEGAGQLIRRKRQAQFYAAYVRPMLEEARKLGLTPADISRLLEEGAGHEQD